MRNDDLVWYAGYGSNLDADRFRCYLHGGRPPGATRTYPGVREPVDPLEVRAFRMTGRLVFAWESPTWGGGIAFQPGADHDLTALVEVGHHVVGPGRYETLRVVGTLEGAPVVTFGCEDPAALGLNAPAPAYVATIARGPRAVHGLTDAAISEYLARCPGRDHSSAGSGG